jgi:hypothetical protein
MCDDSSYAHRLRNLIAAEQRVLQQRPSESTFLVRFVHCEAGQDDDRYRTPGGLALEEALRGVIRLNLADRQRVEADHPLFVRGDEGARRAGCLGVSGVALEPAVKGHLAGDELGKVVRASQRLWPRIAQGLPELLEDARFGVEAAKTLRDPRRSLEELGELVPLGRWEGELPSIRENSLSFGDRGASDEAAVADRACRACGADKSILRILYPEVPAESPRVRSGSHDTRDCTDNVRTLGGS